MLSAGVKIENLDYLAPSAQCIKPVAMPKPSKKSKASGETSVLDELREETVLKEAIKISLNDCLACSGCVTTSETILVRLQSVEELYKQLDENKARSEKGILPKKVIVTLAPQACASVAAYFRCELEEAFAKLLWVFHSRLGVNGFTDGLWAQNISLLEISREFVTRYTSFKKKSEGKLPLMTSACPGWVCYAEKTHPELLPYMSTTKSSQAIVGTTLKRYFAKKWQLPPEEIYHLAIYACFDKKLEASRPDFQLEGGIRETDCVLAAIEIPELLQKEKLEWATIPTDFVSLTCSLELLTQEMYGWDFQLSKTPTDPVSSCGGVSEYESSGAYLEFVLRYAAKALFNHTIEGPLTYQQRRNVNWQDVTLAINGEKVLTFAIAYGFQQIQNITRQLGGKTRTVCPYDFVEVMACPSGCLNGGGQIKASMQLTEENNRELLARVQAIYRSYMAKMRSSPGKFLRYITPSTTLPTTSTSATTTATTTTFSSSVDQIYQSFVEDQIYSSRSQALFHTQYHAVQKTLETQLGEASKEMGSPSGTSSSSSSSTSASNMIALNAGW